MKLVKVRGLHYEDLAGVWIGLTYRDGNWIKTTFNIATEPDHQYHLLAKNGILYLEDIFPNGVKKVYPVPWEAMDCLDYITNIACSIDPIKVRALAEGKPVPEEKIIYLDDFSSQSTTPRRERKPTLPHNGENLLTSHLKPQTTIQPTLKHGSQPQHKPLPQHAQHTPNKKMYTDNHKLDLKGLLAGFVALLLGLLATKNK